MADVKEQDRRAAVNALFREPGVRSWFDEWVHEGMALALMPPVHATLEHRKRELVDLALAFAANREQAEREEREKCAVIADNYANIEHDCDDEARTDAAIRISKRIRARGKQ